MTETNPNPGSQEAIDAGCTCPIHDNRHGKGSYWGDGVYIYSGGCPVHGWMFEAAKKQEEGSDDANS